MIKRIFSALLLGMMIVGISAASENPKREFRGAWMHTIGQSQYKEQTTEQNQAYLRKQLDQLLAAGVNVVIWQVRPSADAFYPSDLEPWSKYLTDGGQPPVPYWDPLQFMIDEAHARGMELHAWLNPYRVTTTKGEKLPKNHPYHKHPERFVKYEGDGKMYFDPALPENRQFIADVVKDIVTRYDVDGIHMDDYFYPYPAGGKDFPDSKSYAKYGKGMNKADWRRQNVDQLIELVHKTIRARKPWVRFGISPFGIWRNKASDPRGSDTNGLQNYDDLYADVLLWAEKGWIDYLVPQLYWELEHKRASYLVLVDWWAKAVDPKCQVYIGQSVEKTMELPDLAPSKEPNQLKHKVDLTRQWETIQGNCWWPAYSLTRDSKGSATALKKTFQATPALVPAYTGISNDKPKAVKKVRLKDNILSWSVVENKGKATDQVKFVVYRFDDASDRNFENPANIMAVTTDHSLEVSLPGTYVVTALDRVNNESSPSNEVRKKN
ncbi:MAG: family 10 glycosylhydrolase [Bacteroidales bacterium]|nr:family 10 glycosylhydrolase [Bacteroidales bacterium]